MRRKGMRIPLHPQKISQPVVKAQVAWELTQELRRKKRHELVKIYDEKDKETHLPQENGEDAPPENPHLLLDLFEEFVSQSVCL